MAITDKKGINVTSGFKLISPAPIDARYVVEDETELQSIIDSGAAYKGLRVWVNSLSKVYEYNGTAFDEKLDIKSTQDWAISGSVQRLEYDYNNNTFSGNTITSSWNKRGYSTEKLLKETFVKSQENSTKINNTTDAIKEVANHVKALEESGVGGGSGGVSESKVQEIVDEKVGDIDAVLDEINGGGTTAGEVSIEFNIGSSTSGGIYTLTQITPFTDWYKVKNARIILKGTNEMATPSDIEAGLPNIMKTIEQGTNNVGLLSLTGTVFNAEGVMSVASILYQNNHGFILTANEDILFMLNMYISLGTTTCTLIVTI